jgi:hypothetical protein
MLRSRTRDGIDFAAPMGAVMTVRGSRIVRALSFIDAARILLALEGRWWPPPSASRIRSRP